MRHGSTSSPRSSARATRRGRAGAVGLLKRLLPKLWRAFPRARLRVRLDGGFATPEIFDHLEAAGVEYVVAMGNNAVLTRHAEPAVAPLRAVVATTQETATAYAEAAYQAGTWAVPGAPLSKPKWCGTTDECRAITRVSSSRICAKRRSGSTPTCIGARGDSENRFKELKHALAFGRTSCTRFWANQLRVTLTAAAFVLFQELQLHADRTALRGAQVPRLRQALITIGVQVVRSVRRIVLHFPRSHPDAVSWARLARASAPPPRNPFLPSPPRGPRAGGVAPDHADPVPGPVASTDRPSHRLNRHDASVHLRHHTRKRLHDEQLSHS